MHKNNSKVSPREIAYKALVSAKREDGFISDTIEEWILQTNPSARDANLAKEIAYGSCRMALALDDIGAKCTTSHKLSLKAKERLLLHTALYQHCYLSRIPLYAIADESLKLAKKYCHTNFVNFLNAVLRKLENFSPILPQGKEPQDLSTRLSYPLFFVESLIRGYGKDVAIKILEAGNESASTVFRIRKEEDLENIPKEAYQQIQDVGVPFATLLDMTFLGSIASSKGAYIQNVTPAVLMQSLKNGKKDPKKILDLCASPGGKLLLAHDLFPAASLYANDVNPVKIDRLRENIDKYQLDVCVSCGQGEDFQGKEGFDLVILDVPCSNAGVLNKRPEARWRLSKERLATICETQIKLLHHSVDLLSEEGEIWYLTCSILPEENELMVDKICKSRNLKARFMKTILPNGKELDGGFACALTRETLS